MQGLNLFLSNIINCSIWLRWTRDTSVITFRGKHTRIVRQLDDLVPGGVWRHFWLGSSHAGPHAHICPTASSEKNVFFFQQYSPGLAYISLQEILTKCGCSHSSWPLSKRSACNSRPPLVTKERWQNTENSWKKKHRPKFKNESKKCDLTAVPAVLLPLRSYIGPGELIVIPYKKHTEMWTDGLSKL